MSLVFSAILPHTPLLIPPIGKDNINKLASTSKAYAKLSRELENKRIDTILIISPHGIIKPQTYNLNLSSKFEADFEDFGDFSTKNCWQGNVGFTYHVREQLETKVPLQLVHEEKLDYGASVPLILLAGNLPKVKIIPLYYSGLPRADHYEFGRLLKKEILISQSRIAVLASGELSHCLTENSPAGYSPKGKKFDKKTIDLIINKKNQDLINLDEQLVSEAKECGLRSIIILLGILDNMEYSPRLLSYEFPFGVGLLVMNFKI